MSYAIFGLIFVLLIVFGVLSSKSWHWVNTVFLILTFLAGAATCGAMAKALKLRTTDMKRAFDEEQRAEKLIAQAEMEIYGSENSITYDPDSLRGLNEQLTLELHDRGRVWFGGQVSANDLNRIFQFSAQRGDANEWNKMDGIVLYAFADGPIDEQTVYPRKYVGAFKVVQESPQQVELEPVVVVDNQQYETPDTTWSLFEKMPQDSRDTFKKLSLEDRANFLGDNFDLATYREALRNQYLRADQLGMQEGTEEYESLLDQYSFDGLTLGEITTFVASQQNRVNPRFEPSPEEVLVEYRFEQKVEGFEVDAAGSIKSGQRFLNGKAIDPMLQAGKPVGFAKGETVLIDQLTADGYQRGDGTPVPPFATRYNVTEVNRYFYRQLKDYPFILADLFRQSERLQEEFTRVKANNDISQGAYDDAQAQIKIRDEIIFGLDEDKRNLESDLQTINGLLDERTAQHQEIQERARQLNQQIQMQYDNIRASNGMLGAKPRRSPGIVSSGR